MTKLQSLVVGMGIAIILPGTTWAGGCPNPLNEGHFEGHTLHASAPGTFAAGEFLTGYQIIEAVEVNPWYPWDQANYEYTLVVSVQVSGVVNIPIGGGQTLRQISFNPGTFAIYEDAGTAAVYTNTATFTDGALILSGTYAPANPWEGIVTATTAQVGGNGVVGITGGSGLDQCLCTDLTIADFLAWLPNSSPSGYKERFGSKWECCVVTSTEQTPWGRVKGLYR